MITKKSQMATDEVVYWIIALMVLVVLFYFIGMYIAKPLLATFADSWKKPEAQNLAIDTTDVSHNVFAGAGTIVASLIGKADIEENQFQIKTKEGYKIIPSITLDTIKGITILKCKEKEFAQISSDNRLIIYTSAYLGDALACLEYDELSLIDGASYYASQGKIFEKYKDSISLAEKISSISKVIGQIKETSEWAFKRDEIFILIEGQWKDTKISFDSRLNGALENNKIKYSGKEIGYVQNGKMIFINQENEYAKMLNNKEIKLTSLNTKEKETLQKRWLIY